MNIPHYVKVGGKRYTVEITDDMQLGRANVSAEILYEDLDIRIAPQAHEKMECDFFHELMHAIAEHLGYREHDEQKLDAFAQALHMVLTDNPGIFLEVKG